MLMYCISILTLFYAMHCDLNESVCDRDCLQLCVGIKTGRSIRLKNNNSILP